MSCNCCYTCGGQALSRESQNPKESIEKKENWILFNFYATFWLKAGQTRSKPKGIFKIFVGNRSDLLDTVRHGSGIQALF